MTPRRPASLLLLVGALLAGCGGGKGAPPEHAAVRAALARFDRAQAGGDAKGTCDGLVAVEEQGRIEVPGEGEREAGAAKEEGADKDAEASHDADQPPAGEAAATACERALARASASRKALKDVRVEVLSVAVKGNEATAQLRTRLTRPDGSKLDQEAVRRLVRVDGRWRVLITEE